VLSIVHEIKRHIGDTKLPVVSPSDIVEAERRLGFPLPELLRQLYTSVGDGGFGPGYGFLGLIKPVPIGEFAGESVVQLYEVFRGGDPENRSWTWPDRMLPVLDWGCAIRSCVGCSTTSLPVLRDEPYVSRLPESPSLEQWLREWVVGRDLWKIRAQ
jgi:hypothetical protein